MVANVSDEEMQEHYDNFFEDVFVECEDKYGEIEEMNVCDNLGDHLVGNVYIKVGTIYFHLPYQIICQVRVALFRLKENFTSVLIRNSLLKFFLKILIKYPSYFSTYQYS